MQELKDAAVDFLKMVVDGRIEEAYDKYVNMEGVHHNVYFPPGFQVLKQAMIDDHAQHPAKQLIVGHVLEDGNLVAVHSHLVIALKEPSMTVVHLFRFDQGKIVEMWDVGQVIPDDSPNTGGAM